MELTDLSRPHRAVGSRDTHKQTRASARAPHDRLVANWPQLVSCPVPCPRRTAAIKHRTSCSVSLHLVRRKCSGPTRWYVAGGGHGGVRRGEVAPETSPAAAAAGPHSQPEKNNTFYTEMLQSGRPLCLYYFTHPFGVLSPEPPRVAATFAAAPADGAGVVSVAGARYTLDLGAGFPATSWFPTPFPGDMWSSPGADVGMGARWPGGRLLPPLRVARPPPPSVWTRSSCTGSGKRSLPPLSAAPFPPSAPSTPPRDRAPRPRTLALRKLGRGQRKTIKGTQQDF
ncbi:unnamed protein product, partial [Iphiclides podalirius]